MKYFIFILSFFIFSCENKTTFDEVKKTYNNKMASYDKIEYNIKRIDTFSKDDVWNKSGKVLIKKIKADTLFGMSFYTISNKNYLYDNYRSFEISNDGRYSFKNGYYGFRGSPGGQLIPSTFFGLDSIYKTVELIETNNRYQLEYGFDNDTTYNITNIKKTIAIDKQTFFPTKIVMTSERFGEKTSKTFLFENVLVNSQVKNSIENYKNELKNLELISNEKPIKTTFIGIKFKRETLPNLWDDNPIVISDKFPALISFWEVWCGPCVKSLPKLKLIQNTYKDKINVIGITTENPKKVKYMLSNKNIEYLNLKGTNELLIDFKINSFPTYFLVDKKGIILKEYAFFSKEIEKDIKELYNKKATLGTE